MTSSGLGPTIGDRLSALPRAAAAHTVLLRRTFALMLAGLGVALLIRGNPADARVPVVVANRDVTPGRVIGADDVRTAYRESGTVPAGALRSSTEVTGHIVAGAMRAGEIFTDLRVLGPRLAGAVTADAHARIVGIRLADAGVADLLHDGDRVDVIAADNAEINHNENEENTSTTARILASDAVVVLVSHAGDTRRDAGRDRVVLLATGADQATTVAAASLHNALTVVFHG